MKPIKHKLMKAKEISLVKEEELPKIKVGDKTKCGCIVKEILEDGRLLVSSQTTAKVIEQKDC